MMNEEYIKRLDFDSDTFEAMKTDMNFILQRMIGSMIEKDSTGRYASGNPRLPALRRKSSESDTALCESRRLYAGVDS